jgi:hypothetical protein
VRFGAEVTIRLDISGTRLVIDVEDDGPAFRMRKQEMLEPFVCGDDARTMGESTGFILGPSIARAIEAIYAASGGCSIACSSKIAIASKR